VKTSFFFFFRLFAAWLIGYLLFLSAWHALIGDRGEVILVIVFILCMAIVVVTGTSHLRRVRFLSDHVDKSTLANRHRRYIEVPFEAGEAFDLVEAAIRELPRVEILEAARDSLQIHAKVTKPTTAPSPDSFFADLGILPNMQAQRIIATVTPGEGVGSLNLVCEAESDAWMDWFFVDGGRNLENLQALTRAITRRISERRRGETKAISDSSAEKELAIAKLGLLHAQVEPHFLYNTLGSAKYLVKSDPDKAEAMLDNLITYLRNSLPRTDNGTTTLGDELERVRAYLEILQFRMGSRLSTHIDVADSLRPVEFPAMMLQTLVENAIKHGLEPKSGGGNIWLMARVTDNQLAVTVADDGLGLNTLNKGTGIGLNNIRERLKLSYGADANLNLVSNFPSGVAATITLPINMKLATAKESNA
jgi:hypothetical protein